MMPQVRDLPELSLRKWSNRIIFVFFLAVGFFGFFAVGHSYRQLAWALAAGAVFGLVYKGNWSWASVVAFGILIVTQALTYDYYPARLTWFERVLFKFQFWAVAMVGIYLAYVLKNRYLARRR